MKLIKSKFLFTIGFLGLAGATQGAEQLSTIGDPSVISSELEISKAEQRDIIDEYFEIESRQRYVGDAINVKRAALAYARDMYDFERVSRYAFSGPTSAYILEVANFIVQNVRPFVRTRWDIDAILRLEGKTFYVNQSQALKEAGLIAVSTPSDLVRLSQPAFSNPSLAYLDMASNLIAQNAARTVYWDTPIAEILRMESHTRYVSQSIAVKTAGLRAVRNRAELLELCRFAFSNPSAEYVRAVDQFRIQNESRFPH